MHSACEQLGSQDDSIGFQIKFRELGDQNFAGDIPWRIKISMDILLRRIYEFSYKIDLYYNHKPFIKHTYLIITVSLLL